MELTRRGVLFRHRSRSVCLVVAADGYGNVGSVVSEFVRPAAAEEETANGARFHELLATHGLRLPATLTACVRREVQHIDFVAVDCQATVESGEAFVQLATDATAGCIDNLPFGERVELPTSSCEDDVRFCKPPPICVALTEGPEHVAAFSSWLCESLTG